MAFFIVRFHIFFISSRVIVPENDDDGHGEWLIFFFLFFSYPLLCFLYYDDLTIHVANLHRCFMDRFSGLDCFDIGSSASLLPSLYNIFHSLRLTFLEEFIKKIWYKPGKEKTLMNINKLRFNLKTSNGSRIRLSTCLPVAELYQLLTGKHDSSQHELIPQC